MMVFVATAIALGVAVLVGVEAAVDPSAAAYAALAAASFGICAGWGALFVMMTGLASRGRWVADLRRPVEAVVSTLPVLTLAMAIVLVFAHRLYPWMDGGPELMPYEEEVVRKTAWWRDPWFFYARSAVYLLVPVLVAEVLRALSRRAARPGGERADILRARLSVAGLPIGFLLGSFAAFDWIMALEPGWVSTIYGATWIASGFATACGAMAFVVWLCRRGGLAARSDDPVHRLGKLLFAATIFWAYLSFAQYLVMWIGNLPSEARYYLHRREGAWGEVGIALIVGGFVVPFLALIPLAVKRHAGRLALVGLWVVAVHALEHAWLVLPARPAVATPWAGGPAFVGIAAAAVALGIVRDRAGARLPRADPLSTPPAEARAE